MATSTIKSGLQADRYELTLGSLSWTQTAGGKYTASTNDFSPSGKIAYACEITSFENLKATDIIQPYLSSGNGKLYIAANTNSFSSGAKVTVRVVYQYK